MTDILIAHSEVYGWIGWLNGHPPRLACASTRESLVAVLQTVLEASSALNSVRQDTLRLFLFLSSSNRLPSPEEVLAHVARTGRPEVRFILSGADPLRNWPPVAAWITAFADRLSRTRSPLRSIVEIETRLDSWPSEFGQFLCRYPGWYILSVLDTGGALDQSRQRQDRAAELADLGVRVQAKIVLTQRTAGRWIELAQQWHIITHAGRMAFVEPSEWDHGEFGDPDPAAISAFLNTIYKTKQFDLWLTDPFATILHTLCRGIDSIPRCATPLVASLCGNAFIAACQCGATACLYANRPSCTCAYARLCDTVHSQSRAKTTHTLPSGRTEQKQIFCTALQTLVPVFLEELVQAAQFQQFLQRRRADERFRIAARDGQLKIWTGKIIADHRDRLGEKHGDPHDLTWVRPHVAGAAGGSAGFPAP